MTRQGSSRYIHGSEKEEQDRLSRLNELINHSSLEAMKLREGDRVLDVGSGLGQLTRGMARAVGPSGCVIGIERDQRQLEECVRLAGAAGEGALADFRRGDVDAFPLQTDEWGKFDVVHARFLLEHLPDPLPVVEQMVRAARPGGRVILEDDDHDLLRLWPEPPGFEELWHAYSSAFRSLGNDPAVGRKLPALIHNAGATPTAITWLYFGACSGEETFPLYVDNLIGIIGGAKEEILKSGQFDAESFGKVLQALREWEGISGASFWYARAWAAGTRKRGHRMPDAEE